MKHQAPTSKPQKSSKLHTTRIIGRCGSGVWRLMFRWSLVLGCWSFIQTTGAAAAPKNNILLIIADDYGADSSALFNSTNAGASLAATPNIDKLGRSGVLFPYFYARPSCS